MKITLIIFLYIISTVVVGQPFKNLVFEGGGMRGVSYAGALLELEATGYLKGIEKVGGTSVGAITALTLSLGYTPKEITDLIGKTDPNKFNDGNFLLFGGGRRLRKHYGWHKGKKFIQWIEKIIEAKTGDPDITFHELHRKKFLDLYVTGTSLNNQKVIVFSHESYPNMKVKDAIRVSMSIPFFFQAVFIDSVGNVLKKKKAKIDYDIMVDGGFISNFPIDVFDQRDSLYQRIVNPYTLGFRLDTEAQLKYDQQKRGLAPVEVESLKNYIGAFFNFIMENMNRAQLTDADWQRTVSIHAELVGPKIKKFTPDELEKLINNGRAAMREYLSERQRR